MKDNFYKQLVEDLPIGYSYQKIICDEDGNACDYEFLEVNAAFERFTGLKGLDIVGKSITEILPHIRMCKFDWINYYGDIAINGGRKELKQFFEFSKRWYKINTYSPEKYYFISSFTDITKEVTQLSEVQRLVEVSEEFLQINDLKNSYQKIADDFLNICGAKYALFNLFDKSGKSFTTVAISGDKEITKKVSNILGFNIEGKKWDHDLILHEKIKLATVTHFHSLRQLNESIIPPPLAILIEKTFNIGEVILIEILKNNKMIGDFTLFMEKDQLFTKDIFAELYTRQLGMAISRKQAEDELAHEKNLADAIFYSAPGMIYLYDNRERLVRWNKKHEDLTGYSSKELSKMSVMDWFEGDRKSYKAIREGIGKAISEGFSECEGDLRKKDGSTVPMYFTISSLILNGKQYFTGVGIDITERKKKEKEILYLSYHDHLTGLYNRRFYEEELKRLDTKRNIPMTIVMGDVNGLKLINDSFGHTMGDELIKKVAQAITKACRTDDIIARLSGDEFVIILPKTDAASATRIIKRIINLSVSEKVGSIDISISFGYETKISEKQDIQVVFKKAENHMYKKKLFESPSMSGKTIKAIINTLHEKNKREEQHSLRVSELCLGMGEALGLQEYENEELKLVGLLHDIGKIAIDEKILNKPGKLTDDEWREIKRHPEIGYRILSTVNDMADMASYVLYHHERWDGKGYPKGLKGSEIPFVSRIISIADSYDAMTSERSYRGALSEEYAIGELQKNSGLQFDPELVSVFIDKVLQELVNYKRRIK
jgi:diguanylate cyclase (GGDEF)-like protein/PAS domain S-box-containing protein